VGLMATILWIAKSPETYCAKNEIFSSKLQPFLQRRHPKK